MASQALTRPPRPLQAPAASRHMHTLPQCVAEGHRPHTVSFTLLPSITTSLLRKSIPIVGLSAKEKESDTKRDARHDLPTSLSPINRSLKEMTKPSPPVGVEEGRDMAHPEMLFRVPVVGQIFERIDSVYRARIHAPPEYSTSNKHNTV